jgi:hypothetical protein
VIECGNFFREGAMSSRFVLITCSILLLFAAAQASSCSGGDDATVESDGAAPTDGQQQTGLPGLTVATVETLPVPASEFGAEYADFDEIEPFRSTTPRDYDAVDAAELSYVVSAAGLNSFDVIVSFTTFVQTFPTSSEAAEALQIDQGDVPASVGAQSDTHSDFEFDVAGVGDAAFGATLQQEGSGPSEVVVFTRGPVKGTAVIASTSGGHEAEVIRLAGLLDERIQAAVGGVAVDQGDAPTPASPGAPQLRVESLECTKEVPLGLVNASGEIRNISDETFSGLEATIEFSSASGEVLVPDPGSGWPPSTVSVQTLEPDESATVVFEPRSNIELAYGVALDYCDITFEDCAGDCQEVVAEKPDDQFEFTVE